MKAKAITILTGVLLLTALPKNLYANEIGLIINGEDFNICTIKDSIKER